MRLLPSLRTLAAVLCLAATGVPQAAAGPFAYTVDGFGDFARLDLGSGSSTFIANNSITTGLGYGPGNALFGVTSGNEFVRVNPHTGATTPIGPTGISTVVFAGLGNSALYAIDSNDSLYRVNPNTGHSSLVGPTGLPGLTNFSNSMAGDGTRLFYTLNVPSGTESMLYSLNLTTGHAHLIGGTGVNDIVGAAFVAGKLYGFESGGQIVTINTTTGQATTGAFGPPLIFGGVDVHPPITTLAAVPEPSTLLLFGLGAAGLARWRRCPSRARSAAE
jgi:hypothetical protein